MLSLGTNTAGTGPAHPAVIAAVQLAAFLQFAERTFVRVILTVDFVVAVQQRRNTRGVPAGSLTGRTGRVRRAELGILIRTVYLTVSAVKLSVTQPTLYNALA